jgi:hypothetical protein
VTLTIACALAGELDERGLVNGNELQHGMCSGWITPEDQPAENIPELEGRKRCNCPCHVHMNKVKRHSIQGWVLRRSMERDAIPWIDREYEA